MIRDSLHVNSNLLRGILIIGSTYLLQKLQKALIIIKIYNYKKV